jgi:hypothetical protein
MEMTTSRRKPAPTGFAETFVRWGWRGVETAFGARTPCNRRWIGECGGEELLATRRAYRARLRELRSA